MKTSIRYLLSVAIKNDKNEIAGFPRIFMYLAFPTSDNEPMFVRKCCMTPNQQFLRRREIGISYHFLTKRLDKTRVFRGFSRLIMFIELFLAKLKKRYGKHISRKIVE